MTSQPFEYSNNEQSNLNNIFTSVVEHSVEYLNRLERRDSTLRYSNSEQRLDPWALPTTGTGTQAAFELFCQQLRPSLVASAGANYWGFVTGGTTPASIVGDWLTSVYDNSTQTIDGMGDISGQIETETIALLRQLFSLPDSFFGSFVTGATMANFTGLGVARQWAGKQLGVDIGRDGMTNEVINNTALVTATPHSSAVKSLSMLGFGRKSLTIIPTLPDREAMDLSALEVYLKNNPKQPVIIIASAATVNTNDFDDFKAINTLKERYNFWLHIDAAFGAFANLNDDYRHLLSGWTSADSITIDCHKWLNVPYDSAVIWVREQHKAHQHATFSNGDAPYLGDADTFNYLNFVPENSRRLRSLPVWFSLIAYGKEGISTIVAQSINNAQSFSAFIEAHSQLILLAPTRLNTVCFAYCDKGCHDNSSKLNTQMLLEKINATQAVFMTPTMLAGKHGIRASFVNWRTNTDDINKVCELIEQILQ